MACLLSSCGGNEPSTTAAVSHVDSVTRSAPDTLRASMDTSAAKDIGTEHQALLKEVQAGRK